MLRHLCIAMLVGSLTSVASANAVTIFLEADQGDLSNFNDSPTNVGELPLGDARVEGQINNAEAAADPEIIGIIDPDIFRFTIAPNTEVESILLSMGSNDHFLGLSAGQTISAVDASLMLVARLVGGDLDLLVYDPSDPQYLPQGGGGMGISSPLGAGDYTIWLQEADADVITDYTFTFRTSAITAIPEPTSLVFLGLIGAAVVTRRRR